MTADRDEYQTERKQEREKHNKTKEEDYRIKAQMEKTPQQNSVTDMMFKQKQLILTGCSAV